MTQYSRKINLFETAAGEEIVGILQEMTLDGRYETGPTYSANSSLYPDHQMPFVEKHKAYLSARPSLNYRHYLSNLRLMTRIR